MYVGEEWTEHMGGSKVNTATTDVEYPSRDLCTHRKFFAVGDWRLAFRAKTPITTLRVSARRVASSLDHQPVCTSVFRVYAEKEHMSSTFIFDFLHNSVITSSTSDPPPV